VNCARAGSTVSAWRSGACLPGRPERLRHAWSIQTGRPYSAMTGRAGCTRPGQPSQVKRQALAKQLRHDQGQALPKGGARMAPRAQQV